MMLAWCACVRLSGSGEVYSRLKQSAFSCCVRFVRADTGQELPLHQSSQQSSPQHQQQQPIYATTADEANGKINIHVSVVFVKSLSDLKKQRAQNRTSVSGPPGQPPQIQQQQQAEANGNGQVPTIPGATEMSSDDFRRFTGNTSDIVGDNRGDKSCCRLM